MDNNRYDEFERKYGNVDAGAKKTAAPDADTEQKVEAQSVHETPSFGTRVTPGIQQQNGPESQSASEVPSFGAQATPGAQQQNAPEIHTPSGAPDGTYRMARPANGTTYVRTEQVEGGPRRGEWSNSGAPYGTVGNDGGYGSSPYPPQPQYANQPPYGQYTNQFVPPVNRGGEKKKKEKKGISGGVIAVLCAACVVLSGACGYLGAWAALHSPSAEGGSGSLVSSNDRTTVLYRSVSTDSEAKTEASLKDVVAAVENSVVEITTEFRSTGYFQYVSSGAGSGVVISEDGYIVTNNHVISDDGQVADSVMVRMKDGTTYEAVLVGRDADTDIAVIKVEAENLTAAVFGNSDELYVGQDIIAIGNPLGELGGTVTEGIISALDREVDVEGVKMNLLQVSAAVNPGNSGGGLFNMKGELVGIINAKSSGSGIEGLGFAIPSLDAQRVAQELMTNGYVTGKPYLGISFYYASDELTAYRYFGSQAPGLYVYKTMEGYNDNVLMPRDRVVEINGTEIVSQDDVAQILKNSEIGDTLNFIVYRQGKRTELEVKVYEYVPDQGDVNFNS